MSLDSDARKRSPAGSSENTRYQKNFVTFQFQTGLSNHLKGHPCRPEPRRFSSGELQFSDFCPCNFLSCFLENVVRASGQVLVVLTPEFLLSLQPTCVRRIWNLVPIHSSERLTSLTSVQMPFIALCERLSISVFVCLTTSMYIKNSENWFSSGSYNLIRGS